MPILALSVSASFLSWSPLSGSAEVTSAVTSPRALAASSRKTVMIAVQREQPAVAGDEPHEIADQRVDAAGLGEDRVERGGLVVGGDHRGAQETREIRAFGGETGDGDEPLLDLGEVAVALCQLEERIGVGPRNVNEHRVLCCQAASPSRFA